MKTACGDAKEGYLNTMACSIVVYLTELKTRTVQQLRIVNLDTLLAAAKLGGATATFGAQLSQMMLIASFVGISSPMQTLATKSCGAGFSLRGMAKAVMEIAGMHNEPNTPFEEGRDCLGKAFDAEGQRDLFVSFMAKLVPLIDACSLEGAGKDRTSVSSAKVRLGDPLAENYPEIDLVVEAAMLYTNKIDLNFSKTQKASFLVSIDALQAMGTWVVVKKLMASIAEEDIDGYTKTLSLLTKNRVGYTTTIGDFTKMLGGMGNAMFNIMSAEQRNVEITMPTFVSIWRMQEQFPYESHGFIYTKVFSEVVLHAFLSDMGSGLSKDMFQTQRSSN